MNKLLQEANSYISFGVKEGYIDLEDFKGMSDQDIIDYYQMSSREKVEYYKWLRKARMNKAEIKKRFNKKFPHLSRWSNVFDNKQVERLLDFIYEEVEKAEKGGKVEKH